MQRAERTGCLASFLFASLMFVEKVRLLCQAAVSSNPDSATSPVGNLGQLVWLSEDLFLPVRMVGRLA